MITMIGWISDQPDIFLHCYYEILNFSIGHSFQINVHIIYLSQAALSRYFDDTVTPYRSSWHWSQFQKLLHCVMVEKLDSNQRSGGGIPWGTPSNTPATPPNFGEALAAFSALSTAQGKFYHTAWGHLLMSLFGLPGCKLATSPLAQAPRQYLPMSPPNQVKRKLKVAPI